MGVLDEILSELEGSPIDEQVKVLCDTISKEEENSIKHKEDAPVGPNIFLCLEVPDVQGKGTSFLTLEREHPGKFIIGLWSRRSKGGEPTGQIKPPLKRIDTWVISEDVPRKILKTYAEKLQYLRGE